MRSPVGKGVRVASPELIVERDDTPATLNSRGEGEPDGVGAIRPNDEVRSDPSRERHCMQIALREWPREVLRQAHHTVEDPPTAVQPEDVQLLVHGHGEPE
jgi:hypothetical protein